MGVLVQLESVPWCEWDACGKVFEIVTNFLNKISLENIW